MPQLCAPNLKPLRVGIDARLVAGHIGGHETWLRGLIRALLRGDDGPENYLLLVAPDEHAWLDSLVTERAELVTSLGADSTMRSIRRRLGRRLPRVRQLWHRTRGQLSKTAVSDGALERAGASIVHFPMQSGFITPVPSIYHPWDLQHLHHPDFFSDAEIQRRERDYRAFCNQAALVVVANKWTKRDVIERYRIPAGKVAVVGVPPALDLRPRTEQSSTLERSLQLPKQFVLYPAQTWPHKNHLRLVQAIALLRDEEGVTVPVVCSGRLTEHFPRIQEEVTRLGLEQQITFVGFVDPEKLRLLFRLAHAMVFPSLFEGWGQPVVEAFQLDLPVAASSASCLPEVTSGAAHLFNPLDVSAIAAAIEAVVTDDVLRNELRVRGREVVRRLDWDEVAQTFRAHYRRLGGRSLTNRDTQLITASLA